MKLFITISTAFIFCAIILTDYAKDFFIFRTIYMGMSVADTLFHEMGHAFFNWLFGVPAIPAILTIFGADQAGGFTITFDRQIAFQIIAYLFLIFFCYFSYDYEKPIFIFAIGFSLFIFCFSFWHHYKIIPAFMGHGGAVIAGGYFFYRSLLNVKNRKDYEQWLNAFFGFFLIFKNLYFAYKIIFDAGERNHYSSKEIFGAAHNDFVVISQEFIGISVSSVAWFLLLFGIVSIITAAILAYNNRHKSYIESTDDD